MVSLTKTKDLIGNIYQLEKNDTLLTIYDGGYQFPVEVSAKKVNGEDKEDFIDLSVNKEDGKIFNVVESLFKNIQRQRCINNFHPDYVDQTKLMIGSTYSVDGCLYLEKIDEDNYVISMFKNRVNGKNYILLYDKTVDDELVYRSFKKLCNNLYLIDEKLDFRQLSIDDISKNNVRVRKENK